MTNQEIAQKIVDKVDSHTEPEIIEMIEVAADYNNIDHNDLYKLVKNLYGHKVKPHKIKINSFNAHENQIVYSN